MKTLSEVKDLSHSSTTAAHYTGFKRDDSIKTARSAPSLRGRMGDVSRVTLKTHTQPYENLKFRVIIFILKVKDSYLKYCLKTQYIFLTPESKAFRI